MFVFDGGVLDETDLAGMVFADSEIVSADFHTLEEARYKVKSLLADRLAAALQAVELGVTVLCEQGRRVAYTLTEPRPEQGAQANGSDLPDLAHR